MTKDESSSSINNHLKISDATKRAVIVKMIENEAFTERTAITKEVLELEGEEIYAFNQLLDLKDILEIEKKDIKYYHLADRFKYFKSYRKEVVKGLSISVLLFIILFLLAGIVSIIYQFITQ